MNPEELARQAAQQQTTNPRAKTLDKIRKLELVGPSFGLDQAEIQDFATKQRIQLLVEAGVPSDKIQSNPDLLAAQAMEVITKGYTPEQDSSLKDAAAKKRQDLQIEQEFKQQSGDPEAQTKLKGVEDSLDLLEQNLKQVGSRGAGTGQLAQLAAQVTGGAGIAGFGSEVSDYEGLRNSLIGPLARIISGESGALNEGDIARAEGLLPKVTEDKAAAERKLKTLRDLVEKRKSAASGTGTAAPAPGGAQVGRFVVEVE